MASIRKVVIVRASPEDVWAAIRDLGRLPKLAAGAVAQAKMDGDMRVTVYRGAPEIREWVVDLDDIHRRLAMTATGGAILHHNSAIEVLPEGDKHARVVWVCDFLPDSLMGTIRKIMNQTVASAKKTLEEGARTRRPRPAKTTVKKPKPENPRRKKRT